MKARNQHLMKDIANRKRNIFDAIGKYIPGYAGYANRDERRNNDKKLRDIICTILNSSINNIEVQLINLVKNENLVGAAKLETFRKELETLCAKIRTLPYGSSAFFSENQIQDEQLDLIYYYDERLLNSAGVLSTSFTKIEENIFEIEAASAALHLMKEILTERTNYIHEYK